MLCLVATLPHPPCAVNRTVRHLAAAACREAHQFAALDDITNRPSMASYENLVREQLNALGYNSEAIPDAVRGATQTRN